MSRKDYLKSLFDKSKSSIKKGEPLSPFTFLDSRAESSILMTYIVKVSIDYGVNIPLRINIFYATIIGSFLDSGLVVPVAKVVLDYIIGNIASLQTDFKTLVPLIGKDLLVEQTLITEKENIINSLNNLSKYGIDVGNMTEKITKTCAPYKQTIKNNCYISHAKDIIEQIGIEFLKTLPSINGEIATPCPCLKHRFDCSLCGTRITTNDYKYSIKDGILVCINNGCNIVITRILPKYGKNFSAPH